jgi:hypothetical protein
MPQQWMAHDILSQDDPVEQDEKPDDNFMSEVFECLDAITESKKELNLTDAFLKSAMPLICRVISLYPDCVLLVNEANKRNFSPRERYVFLFNVIRARRRNRVKWPKRITDPKMELVQEIFQCNQKRATEIISVLTDSQLNTKIEKHKSKKGGLV